MNNDTKKQIISMQASKLADALIETIDNTGQLFVESITGDEEDSLRLKVETLTMALLKVAEKADCSVVQVAIAPSHFLAMGITDKEETEGNKQAFADTQEVIERISNLADFECDCPHCTNKTNLH